MSNFDDAFAALIGHEGGFGNIRSDPGNWTGGKVGVGQLKGTKYGISAAAYPNIDIKNLTLDQAKAIYLRDYWRPVRADELPYAIAFSLFDAAVNSGTGQAVKWLQEAVGALQDGSFGPKTMAALQALPALVVAARMEGWRLIAMTDMKVWPTFSRGWAKRIGKNLVGFA